MKIGIISQKGLTLRKRIRDKPSFSNNIKRVEKDIVIFNTIKHVENETHLKGPDNEDS